MSTRFTGIAFGTGPVGYQADKDEKIREVVEKINKETEAAGLPWWAGMFNPEIVKLASAEGCECNCTEGENKSTGRGGCDCVKEERERELREKIEKVKAENERIRGELEKQRERLREADEKVIEALSWATKGLAKGTALLEGDVSKAEALGVISTMADLCEAMSKLRGSMNGVSLYGYGA